MQRRLIIPKLKVHVTGELLTKDLHALMRDAARTFRRKNLLYAPPDDLVGELTGYKFIYTGRDCGGYCDRANKVIALYPYDVNDPKIFYSPLPMNNRMWITKTLLHEIGHALQAEAELLESRNERLLSWRLHLEHQVESVAYTLHKQLYYHLPHQYFNSYFDKEGVEFLRNWYGNYIEDDLL